MAKRKTSVVAKYIEPGYETMFANSCDPKLLDVYQQYRDNFTKEQIVPWIHELIGQTGYSEEEKASFKRSESVLISVTDCITAKLLLNKVFLPSDVIERLSVKIERTIQNGRSTRLTKINIDKTRERITNAIAFIEGKLDDQDYSFSIFTYLQKLEATSKYAKAIVSKYQPVLDELNAALSKSDKQIIEAYSHVSSEEIVKVRDYIETIIRDAKLFETFKEASKKYKQTKKGRNVDLTNTTLKYKLSDKGLGLTSIHPNQIPGCRELWTYNTEKRLLARFLAKDEKGINVEGSTLVNIDEENSIAKILRTPDTTLHLFMETSKLQLKKFMDTLSTKKIKPQGQIRINTMLLRSLK